MLNLEKNPLFSVVIWHWVLGAVWEEEGDDGGEGCGEDGWEDFSALGLPGVHAACEVVCYADAYKHDGHAAKHANHVDCAGFELETD